MKTYKYITTCILALVSFLPMQAQKVDKEAMYIYQKDGNVNIFFRNEVTSISIELKDGELYQVVKTGERQHAFPVSNIQSVSFVNPVEDTYKPTIIEDEETPTFGKFVDLGLPSGNRWASFNVGASMPEEYGGYYAWGETTEKEVNNWSTYIHCDGSYYNCHDLGSDISGTEYDVAHVKWGGNWCIPTLDDINELLDNCTSEWTMLNGVNGRKFTGSNGNSIFLPAAGYRKGGDLYDAGSEGYYWSSGQTPAYSDYVSDYVSDFDIYFGCVNMFHGYRYYGQSVRPVRHGLPISTHEVELFVGKSKTVDIFSGSGYYTIESGNPEVATATINKNAILINALNKGETTIMVTDIQLEVAAIITVKVKSAAPKEIIDLGLPSGTKWMNCNVGANSPEEYGDYLTWDEAQSYDCPSLDEIKELLEYCPSEWTTLNGVNGRKFTGPNGNSIFLPAAGYPWYGDLKNVGAGGYYWSSSQLSSDSDSAYYLDFGSVGASLYDSYRGDCQSVRPVVRN
ncbi:MAG: pilus assembly protein N-terminal domain-containing protein [Prevotella sp.]|nr:pilus assembly protein N-terminal domain-containing protein [Prevotella sp.]